MSRPRMTLRSGPLDVFIREARRRANDLALEWAAGWIEESARLNGDPAVLVFAANMATTIRAERHGARDPERIAAEATGEFFCYDYETDEIPVKCQRPCDKCWNNRNDNE